MLTSAWTRLPVLGDYGTRDIIAFQVARLPCYQGMADSRKATCIVTHEGKNKNMKDHEELINGI